MLTPSEIRGRRECRVPAAPMVTARKTCAKARVDRQVQPRHPGIPCAVVYGLLRALLGEPDFVVTVASAMTLASSPTWRQPRGARTTRLRRPRPHRPSSMPPRPPHPASRFVTFAIRPSSIEAGRRGESPISEKRKANYFRRALLKALNCLDSARQISVCAQAISRGRRLLAREAAKANWADSARRANRSRSISPRVPAARSVVAGGRLRTVTFAANWSQHGGSTQRATNDGWSVHGLQDGRDER